MALANYTELQSAVARHLHRTDLTDVIPDLIALGEHRIFSDLNSRMQDTVTTLSTVASQETIALPSDFINARTLTNTGVTPFDPMNYKSPDQFMRDAATATPAVPRAYTIIGANLYLAPIPDAIYALRLVYQQKVPALATAQSGTNWLITQFPAVYLYATLCESAPYIRDDARMTLWETLYARAIEGVNAQDWSSMATMSVKGDIKL